MDTRRPHDILATDDLPKDRARLRFFPLSGDDAAMLKLETEDERHAWLKENVATSERLAMHLESLGADWLAKRARDGVYSDFRSTHETPKGLLIADLKRAHLYTVARLVLEGEYDDTRAEAQAWADEQTGELRKRIEEIDAEESHGA